jgi:hypothetical protein
MATEPLNLIQVQSRLQDPLTVTNQDLLKYANGANPEVPSFLALIEMNRRKQIEDTTAQFQSANMPSVKDQLAQSLTNPTMTGQDKMIQVNPTNAPIGIINPTKLSQPAQPTASPFGLPPQVNMTAPPQVPPPVQAARGGLMNLPVNHFKSSSYAGGGIIAFGDPAQNPNEDQLVQGPMTSSQLLQKRVMLGKPTGDVSEPPVYENRFVPQAEPAKPQTRLEGILATLPKQQDLGVTKPEALTPEQAFENIKRAQNLAGVSADPYAETKKRQEALEARQLAEYERGGIDRLLAQAAAFATADPAKGFGYAAAVSSTASRALEKEQNALRTQQETAGIEFQKSMAKEQDAKARGDAAAITSAVEERKKAEVEYAKLVQQSNKIEQDRIQLAVTAEHYQSSDENAKEQNKIMDLYHKGQISALEAKNRIDELQANNTATHYADLASYNKRYLTYLENKEANTDKPTKEDKNIAKAEANTNGDPQYKREAERLGVNGGLEPGSPEFNAALERMYEIRKFHFKAAKAELPPMMPLPQAIEMAKKPGWWARNAPEFLGGLPSTPAKVDTGGFKYIGKE